MKKQYSESAGAVERERERERESILLNKSKGITLVSLVITIILLLILAGISIQAMTSTGLFESAGRAQKEAKRAQIVEWLNLKLIEQQSENYTGMAEDIIKATQKSIIDSKDELQGIGKEITVEDTKTEEDGEKVDIYFYVQVDKDVYKVEMKGAQFIGESGKFPPVIKIESVTSTTNSITVKISTKRNEGGKLEFYIKPEDDEKYNNIKTIKTEKNADNLEFTYNELEQNKKYSIKIVAIAENKQRTEVIREDIQVGNVPELTTQNVEFTYSPSSWTNESVTVTAELKEENVQGYTLKITDGNPINPDKQTAKNWANASDGITVDTNKTIYAVLIDNEGQIGGAATGNVDKIDKDNPTINNVTGVTIVSGNTGNITISGAEDTGGSGLSAYYVSTQNTTPAENASGWVSNTASSFTYPVKTKGTYYVWVKDNAKNISEPKSCTVTELSAVAKVENTYYSSLENAVGAITSTGTITLVNDDKGIITIPQGKDIKIGAEGHTFNGMITNEGTLEILSGHFICDGTVSGSSGVVGNKGNLIVSGGTLETLNYYVIDNFEGSSLKVLGGTIILKENVESWAVTIHNRTNAKAEIVDGNIECYAYGTSGATLYNYGEMIISGGKMYSQLCATIINSSNGNNSPKLTINGGNIYGEGKNALNCVISNATLGTVNIFGGTISGSALTSAVIINGGNINIQGGNISSEDSGLVYNVKPGVVTITNGRLTSKKTCIGNESTLNVSGGIIESNDEYYILNNNGTVTVTGGTFYGNKGY